ncbi:MAG: hypothetical protein GTN62_15045 [Gemmatimonadales bacterium]|nr:hypothetical protein [Gemmatimonadales bacterium]NIN13403.1 hypothetical protein [Gemmatimonadales bacterium]NIN51406.1 hypothetical protein [Gemmatimonadales bacterium]NIP08870.1 hypothetical protein [Gemmatimonadales bacterium]NIQ99864.1 hypothetical protein [Gemmatimonadales bacterium]
MKAVPRTLSLLAGLLAVAVISCEGPAEPVPGALQAELVSPDGDNGAAVLEFSGAAISRVTPTEGMAYSNQVGDVTRVVVILDTPGRISLELSVDDINTPPAATVLEVADGNNQLRSALSGYTVRYTMVAQQ